MRAQSLVHVMQHQDVARVVEILYSEYLLGFGDAFFCERDGLELLIDSVVLFLAQLRDRAIDDVVGVGRFLGGARDDQRRARFVDENRVDLVDDREIVFALNVVVQVELHIVAQIVEAEFVVLAVSDVGEVGGLAILVAHPVHDDADAEPEKIVDAPHPFGVAPRQVVVDGDDVHAAPGQAH